MAGCSSIKNLADFPEDVLGCIFSHLAPSCLRSVRRTGRAFRSASLPIIRALSTTLPRKDLPKQFSALSYVTNLTLEVRDLPSLALAASPYCSARLCHLKLVSLPLIRWSSTLNDFECHPHCELLKAGLAAATRLTRVTLDNCADVLHLVAPACPQLLQLELPDFHYVAPYPGPTMEARSDPLAKLSLLSSLHTLRCTRKYEQWLRQPWGPLLAELAHLPNLRSLATVTPEDAAELEALASLTQLTQLVVNRSHLSANQLLAGLSRLSRLKNLQLLRSWLPGPSFEPALANLPQLERLCLSDEDWEMRGIDIAPPLAGLSGLTALELLGVTIAVEEAGVLVQPWASRLRCLSLQVGAYVTGSYWAGF